MPAAAAATLQYNAVGGWGGVVVQFGLDGLFPVARVGAPLSAPSDRKDTTLFVADTLSWSRDRHSIKAGVDFRYLRNGIVHGGYSRGFVYSSNVGEFTSDSAGCNEVCLLAFAAPSFDYALRQPLPYEGLFSSFGLAAYVQDTWRIHPKFTVSLGLRYEYFSTPEEEDGRIWNFDSAANGLVQQGRTTVLDPFGNICPGPALHGGVPGARPSSCPGPVTPMATAVSPTRTGTTSRHAPASPGTCLGTGRRWHAQG